MKFWAESLARASGAMERGFSGTGVEGMAGVATRGLLGVEEGRVGEGGGLGDLVFGVMGAKTTVFLKMESRKK